MYYYDESGDMRWTDDEETAARTHVRNMLEARRYPLEPNAVGQLHQVLGSAPIDVSRAEALRLVRQALGTLGLSHLRVEDAVEVLDDGWKLILGVST